MFKFTAKSVILDIADNWGSSALGLRSVDFYNNGSKILNVAPTAYATTEYSSNYIAEYVFDTDLSKTGTSYQTAWYTSQNTNQRLIVVFDSDTTFDEIRINNYYTETGGEDSGVKNVKINISADVITDTVYNAEITNSQLIFDGRFEEHVASDVEDEQVLLLIEPAPSSEYANYKIITIDSSKIDSDLTNFPLPLPLGISVGLNAFDITDIFTEVGGNHLKIAVALSDDTQLYVEVEEWDEVIQEGLLWVSLNTWTISSTEDTELYLYYDSTQADNTGYVGTPGNRTEVWKSEITNRYGMSQSPSDGVNSIIDSTINANHGTPGGAMTNSNLVDGQIGKAIYFDGTDDHLDLNAKLIDHSGPRSLEFFFKTSSVTLQSLYSDAYHNTDNTGTWVLLQSDVDEVRVYEVRGISGQAPLYSLSGLYVFYDDNWHQFVFTWDGTTNTNAAKIYIDGQLVIEATADYPASGSVSQYNSMLGAHYDSDGSFRSLLNGLISESKFYNTVCSNAWIKADYHAQTDNLITWSVPVTEINIVNDTDAEWNAGQLSQVESVTDVLQLGDRQFLSFDGVGDYVEVPYSATLAEITATYTLSLWMKRLSGFGTADRFLGRMPGLSTYASGIWNIQFDSDNEIYLDVGGSGTYQLTSGFSITDSSVNRIDITRDGSTIYTYINGVLAGTNGIAAGELGQTSEPIFVGAGYGAYCNCEISAVELRDVYLTQQQIQDDMYARLKGTEPGLVAYYPFDEGIGTTLTDNAGTNNGTITGATWGTEAADVGERRETIDLSVLGGIGESTIDWQGHSGFSFDGVDDYVETTENVDIVGKDHTILMWVKFLSIPSSSSQIYGQGNSVNTVWVDGTILRAHALDSSGLLHYGDTSFSPSTGVGYLIGHRFNNSTGEINSIIDNTISSDLTSSTSRTLGNFKFSFGNSVNIIISDVRIYDKWLTSTEIQDNMNTRLQGNEPGLVAYYPMDNGTVTDHAGTNDGTVYGAVPFYTEIETRYSTDAGLNWTSWVKETRGNSITGIAAGVDVTSGALLECRQVFQTDDVTVSPELESLSILIDEVIIYTFTGYVKVEGVPKVREVLLYNRNSYLLEDWTTSASGTGYFELTTTGGGVYFANILPLMEENYNILAFDKIIFG